MLNARVLELLGLLASLKLLLSDVAAAMADDDTLLCHQVTLMLVVQLQLSVVADLVELSLGRVQDLVRHPEDVVPVLLDPDPDGRTLVDPILVDGLELISELLAHLGEPEPTLSDHDRNQTRVDMTLALSLMVTHQALDQAVQHGLCLMKLHLIIALEVDLVVIDLDLEIVNALGQERNDVVKLQKNLTMEERPALNGGGIEKRTALSDITHDGREIG